MCDMLQRNNMINTESIINELACLFCEGILYTENRTKKDLLNLMAALHTYRSLGIIRRERIFV